MAAQKLETGKPFPPITVPRLGGGTVDLGARTGGHDWKMVVVYRGKHCPLCTRYLKELNGALPALHELSIDLVVVSADSEQRATDHMAEISPDFPVGYDLDIEQMQALGLYVSGVRNGTNVERPFAEPGLFVVNAQGDLQIIDISNVPFARPGVDSLLKGLNFVRNREGDYPVNGSHI